MNIKTLCLIINLIPFQIKKMIKFPLNNGVIIKGSPNGCRLYDYKGITLLPLDDLSIKSCSKGTVILVSKNSDPVVGSSVVIKSDSIFYYYSGLDTIVALKNQVIDKGAIIGMKDKKNIYKETIYFSVTIKNKQVDAEKYVIYNK